METKNAYVWSWVEGEGRKRGTDQLAVEEPLEIRVDTRSIAITMRTPGHDEELAAGFLLSEGLIGGKRDLAAIRPYARNRFGNVIDLFLAPGVEIDFERLTRHVFMSSSCGLCGKATLAAVRQRFSPVKSSLRVGTRILSGLPPQLLANQRTFGKTGGLHAVGLFDAKGRLIVVREDVGRHNAADKVLGHALLNGLLPLNRHIFMISGRASFEIMQKALAARVPVVAAVSAPSSLAVQFARDNLQTLIGFLREGRMNIYAGQQRVVE